MDVTVSDPTPNLEAAGRDVLHGYDQARRALGRRLSLGGNDLATLQFLMSADQVGAAEIANHLGITSASTTVLIDRLEQRKYVRRASHPSDRRRRILQLTERATKDVLGSLEPLLQAEVALRRRYAVSDQEMIARYLTDLAALYEEYSFSLDTTS